MIDTKDAVLLEGKYLVAARALRDISSEIDMLYHRQGECRKVLDEVLSVGEQGVNIDGVALVAVGRTRRTFVAGLAKANLDAATLAKITTLQPDPDKAREVLTDDEYDRCCSYAPAWAVAL